VCVRIFEGLCGYGYRLGRLGTVDVLFILGVLCHEWVYCLFRGKVMWEGVV